MLHMRGACPAAGGPLAPSVERAAPSRLFTNSTTRVYIVGSNLLESGVARCSLADDGGGWELDGPAKVSVPATVHNTTHASCVPPKMRLGGLAQLTLALDGRHFSLAVAVEYAPLLSASVARRPYTSEATGAVLVRVDPSVSSPSVAAELLGADGATRLLLAATAVPRSSGASKLSFALPSTTTTAWGLPLRVSLLSAGTVVAHTNTSLVLLGRSTPNQAVIDLERRSVLCTDSFIALGPANGHDDHYEPAPMVQSPALTWQLAARGFNVIVLDGTKDLNTTLAAMDLLADVGIRVLFILREFADTNVANTTATWAHLTEVVTAVRDHPGLLGWYTWDDCCGQYTHGADTMAARYRALKFLDPFHPLVSPLISTRTEYMFARDADAFAPDGWDAAADLFMYESYVLPHVAETMATPGVALRYPLDWQPLW